MGILTVGCLSFCGSAQQEIPCLVSPDFGCQCDTGVLCRNTEFSVLGAQTEAFLEALPPKHIEFNEGCNL